MTAIVVAVMVFTVSATIIACMRFRTDPPHESLLSQSSYWVGAFVVYEIAGKMAMLLDLSVEREFERELNNSARHVKTEGRDAVTWRPSACSGVPFSFL